jgi:hypothetical protein
VQFVQTVASVAPTVLEAVPAGQPVQEADPALSA